MAMNADSLYISLKAEEILAEIQEGIDQAERGEVLTLEESRTRHEQKYGKVQ